MNKEKYIKLLEQRLEDLDSMMTSGLSAEKFIAAVKTEIKIAKELYEMKIRTDNVRFNLTD